MALACTGKNRNLYFILGWKLEGKKLLVRLTCGRKENTKLVFKEQDGMAWIGFIQLRSGNSGGLL
jgi:hypothetical protein